MISPDKACDIARGLELPDVIPSGVQAVSSTGLSLWIKASDLDYSNLPPSQRWKLVDAVDGMDSFPDWAVLPEQILFQRQQLADGNVVMTNGVLGRDNPTWLIQNSSPLWISFIACIVENDGFNVEPSKMFDVTPVFGYLAPKGGTTNLCNEAERYQDFCEFRVTFPGSLCASTEGLAPHYLTIQTEEKDLWVLGIES